MRTRKSLFRLRLHGAANPNFSSSQLRIVLWKNSFFDLSNRIKIVTIYKSVVNRKEPEPQLLISAPASGGNLISARRLLAPVSQHWVYTLSFCAESHITFFCILLPICFYGIFLRTTVLALYSYSVHPLHCCIHVDVFQKIFYIYILAYTQQDQHSGHNDLAQFLRLLVPVLIIYLQTSIWIISYIQYIY